MPKRKAYACKEKFKRDTPGMNKEIPSEEEDEAQGEGDY